MDRLTPEHWRNYDPWEMCELGKDCKRSCVNNGAWCKVAIKLRRLAAYEDTGLTPEEIRDSVKLLQRTATNYETSVKMHGITTQLLNRASVDLARLTAERDAAVSEMKRIVDAVREAHCDETCCFACKYDYDTSITDTGDYACECPGFERDDCFEWRGVKEVLK